MLCAANVDMGGTRIDFFCMTEKRFGDLCFYMNLGLYVGRMYAVLEKVFSGFIENYLLSIRLFVSHVQFT